MESITLQLPYKGQRDYLHGTDMYQAIVSAIKNVEPEAFIGQFRMTIHKIARHQCQLLCSAAPISTPRPENTVAEFSFVSAISNIIGWIVETNMSVVKRIPYPEEEILKNCIIQGRKIMIQGRVPFLPIEVLVAMNKELHLICSPSKSGKLFFTRLDLNRLLQPTDILSFQIEMTQTVKNRLTKSEVFVEGKKIGYIYFSLVSI